MKKEPALITGFVQAVLVLAIAFGAQLAETQVDAILAAVAAAIALGSAVITRYFVVPKGQQAETK